MLPTLATQHLPHPASAAAPPTPKDQTLITRNPSLNCRCFLFLSTWLPPTYIRTYDEHRTSAINTAMQSSNSRTETAISALVQAFLPNRQIVKNGNKGDGTWSRGLTSFPFPRRETTRRKAYFTYASVSCLLRVAPSGCDSSQEQPSIYEGRRSKAAWKQSILSFLNGRRVHCRIEQE